MIKLGYRFFIAGLVLFLGHIAYTRYYADNNNEAINTFATVKIQRGTLRLAVNASGTVEPEEIVDIGAQVAGKIKSIGYDILKKTIDYGSEVNEGAVLLEIDDSLYLTDLMQAEAGLKRAQALSQQASAKYTQAEKEWNRAKKLGKSAVLAETSSDSSETAYLLAKADVSIADAELSQAAASIAKALRNLENCVIRSPIHGVVIDRRVNVGQTVLASLNAPSLFLIAKDLKQMELWVPVNEADITNIHQDQAVIFTVDAIPGAEFKGTVGKIRLNASMTQNIVTYVVEVKTENTEGKLLPYLTANVKFLLKQFDNVLLVPASALRWKPSSEQVSNSLEYQFAPESNVVWLYKDSISIPFEVKIIATDGINTAIEGEGIAEGLDVIVGDLPSPTSDIGRISPFAPTPFKRSSNRDKH